MSRSGTSARDAASAALAERHDRDDLLSGLDLSGSDDRVADVLLDLARLDNTPRGVALARHLEEEREPVTLLLTAARAVFHGEVPSLLTSATMPSV